MRAWWRETPVASHWIVASGAAADHVDAFHQHDVPVFVDEGTASARPAAPARGAGLHGVTDEAVAEPVHGPENDWLGRGIIEGTANLRHEPGEIRFLDERRRPQALLQLGFRHRAVAIDQEERQQFERLGREMNLVAAGENLPRLVVELEPAKAVRHAGHCIHAAKLRPRL